MSHITIAVDAMGGDHGTKVTVNAALHALERVSAMRLILVGDEKQILSSLNKKRAQKKRARIEIIHTEESVAMDELPSFALRHKRHSSMCLALNAVSTGSAQACVSAGNTGALMAFGRSVLRMLPGIDRPAIITVMPRIGGYTYLLDLGANLDCSSEHLYQFAIMGSVLASVMSGKPAPRVALLNVGEEKIKGTSTIKAAAKRMQESALHYVGFVEGDDIFHGNVDVIVCDGFVGNILLKSCEGLVKFIHHTTKVSFLSSWYGQLMAYMAKPVLKKVLSKVNPSNYNGATLIGLKHTLIKSHGSADLQAFSNAIAFAYQQAQQSVPNRVAHQIQALVENHDTNERKVT